MRIDGCPPRPTLNRVTALLLHPSLGRRARALGPRLSMTQKMSSSKWLSASWKISRGIRSGVVASVRSQLCKTCEHSPCEMGASCAPRPRCDLARPRSAGSPLSMNVWKASSYGPGHALRSRICWHHAISVSAGLKTRPPTRRQGGGVGSGSCTARARAAAASP